VVSIRPATPVLAEGARASTQDYSPTEE